MQTASGGQASRVGASPMQGAKGFTLVELMIVVAIIGILAAIAYPSYLDQVLRSNRTEGRTLLLDAAARQERFFSNNNTYATTMTALGYTQDTATSNTRSENDLYRVAVTTTVTNGRSLDFTLTATPLPDRGQDRDTRCTSLIVNNRGERTFTGTGPDCW